MNISKYKIILLLILILVSAAELYLLIFEHYILAGLIIFSVLFNYLSFFRSKDKNGIYIYTKGDQQHSEKSHFQNISSITHIDDPNKSTDVSKMIPVRTNLKFHPDSKLSNEYTYLVNPKSVDMTVRGPFRENQDIEPVLALIKKEDNYSLRYIWCRTEVLKNERFTHKTL